MAERTLVKTVGAVEKPKGRTQFGSGLCQGQNIGNMWELCMTIENKCPAG